MLHILPRVATVLSLFAYLKGKLNSGFFHDFFINNFYLQGHQNEGLVEINEHLIKKWQEKHYKCIKPGFTCLGVAAVCMAALLYVD